MRVCRCAADDCVADVLQCDRCGCVWFIADGFAVRHCRHVQYAADSVQWISIWQVCGHTMDDRVCVIDVSVSDVCVRDRCARACVRVWVSGPVSSILGQSKFLHHPAHFLPWHIWCFSTPPITHAEIDYVQLCAPMCWCISVIRRLINFINLL